MSVHDDCLNEIKDLAANAQSSPTGPFFQCNSPLKICKEYHEVLDRLCEKRYLQNKKTIYYYVNKDVDLWPNDYASL